MDSEKNWLDVPAPDKWMTGWDNYHKKILEGSEKILQDLSFIASSVQVVGMNIYGKVEGWTLLSIGRDERLLRPGDLRGYVWIVANKPTGKEKEEEKT